MARRHGQDQERQRLARTTLSVPSDTLSGQSHVNEYKELQAGYCVPTSLRRGMISFELHPTSHTPSPEAHGRGYVMPNGTPLRLVNKHANMDHTLF